MLKKLGTIRKIDWNLKNNKYESTLTKALASENDDLIKSVLSIPEIIYDTKYLMIEGVYCTAIDIIPKLLTSMIREEVNMAIRCKCREAIILFAKMSGLENLADFIYEETKRRYLKVLKSPECPVS